MLAEISDVDSKQDIVSANLVQTLHIEGQVIRLVVHSLNPALHARKRLEEAIRFRLEKAFGNHVQVDCEIKAVSGIS